MVNVAQDKIQDNVVKNEKLTKDNLFNVFRNATKLLGQVYAYKSWSNETKTEEIKSVFKSIEHYLGEIDLADLSQKDAKMLGFGTWDASGLMLIPLYLKNVIKNKCVVYDIFGESSVWDVDSIDDDTRFGMLAYGFFLKDIDKEKALKQLKEGNEL